MANKEPIELPSAWQLFKPSIGVLTENSWTFIALFGIVLGSSVISNITKNQMDSPVMALLYVASLVTSIVIAPAIPYAILRSAREKTVTVSEAAQAGLPFVARYLILQILFCLAVVVGLILFIVPGLFALQRFYLASYYLIDKNVGVIEAFKMSAADAKDYSSAIWGMLAVTGLMIISFITVILIPAGLVALVAYLAAPGIRYLQIQKAKKA